MLSSRPRPRDRGSPLVRVGPLRYGASHVHAGLRSRARHVRARGGLTMADDDPVRDAPEQGEAGQRFFGFDEDITGVAVPAELPILPLRGVVIFPSAIVPLLISRGASLKLVESALAGDRMLGLFAQRNPEEESPPPEALYARGTAGRILKMLK